jgi:hypothetical protein
MGKCFSVLGLKTTLPPSAFYINKALADVTKQETMKEKLRKKLEQDDRDFNWFWKYRVGKKLSSYSHFMNMLSDKHNAELITEIKEIITNFLAEK